MRSWIDTRRFVPLRVEKYLSSGLLARRIDTIRVANDDEGRPIPANLTVRGVRDRDVLDRAPAWVLIGLDPDDALVVFERDRPVGNGEDEGAIGALIVFPAAVRLLERARGAFLRTPRRR